jgi:hypothetical protein
MSNVFISAGAISIIYLIAKFIEMRFIDKENRPVKELVKDTFIVYICILIGYSILEQIEPLIEQSTELPAASVFTGNPDF